MDERKQKKDYRKTKKFSALRRSMLDSLALRGMNEAAYTDKVEEYMDFWERRCQLRDDVAERGLSVADDRGRVMENRSVSLEVQVSRQMLNIFNALGFQAEKEEREADDDEL